MDIIRLKCFLENLYLNYNKRCYVSPDPLQFLYQYEDIKDREIVGFIASSLAYGRVNLIIKNVDFILQKIKKPYEFLVCGEIDNLRNELRDFKHRFTKGDDVFYLLKGIKKVISEYGSLENCLNYQYTKSDNLLESLSFLVSKLNINGQRNFLLSDPKSGGACKRLFLFLRWMVRKDDVDCGGWNFIKPRDLIVPLDTHLFRISRELGLTTRRQADMKTAIEITENFRLINPDDPVKYDFVLTRFGIRRDGEFQRDLYEMCNSHHEISQVI